MEACSISNTSRVPFPEARVHHIGQRIDAFWEAEELGCAPPPSCKICKNCPDCRYRGEHLTARQRSVVEEMSASLKLTNGKPPLQISYPFNEHVWKQVSNHRQAIAVQKSHEKLIKKQGILEEYNCEMQKALEIGSVVPLTQKDIDEWTGPVHYITLFAVQKPSSTSTKVRIVSDSKMKNNLTGRSFNDLLKPVPNALSDLFSILIGFR